MICVFISIDVVSDSPLNWINPPGLLPRLVSHLACQFSSGLQYQQYFNNKNLHWVKTTACHFPLLYIISNLSSRTLSSEMVDWRNSWCIASAYISTDLIPVPRASVLDWSIMWIMDTLDTNLLQIVSVSMVFFPLYSWSRSKKPCRVKTLGEQQRPHCWNLPWVLILISSSHQNPY